MSFEAQPGSPRHNVETVTGGEVWDNPIIRPKHRNHYILLQNVGHSNCTINHHLGGFRQFPSG